MTIPGKVTVDVQNIQISSSQKSEKSGLSPSGVLQDGEDVDFHGVKILGPVNLASSTPEDASRMFSRNIQSFLQGIMKDGELNLDFEDEVVSGTCITHEGKVVHEMVKKAMEGSQS